MSAAEPDVRYALYAAMYGLPDEAAIEFPLVVKHQDAGMAVAGATLLHRDAAGRVQLQQPGGGSVAYATGVGIALGFAASYWVPVPFLSAAIGGAIGWFVGRRMRDRESAILSAALAEVVPRRAVAIVAVVDDRLIGMLNAELGLALRTHAMLLDDPEILSLARALVRGNTTVGEDLEELAEAQRVHRRDFPDAPNPW